MFLPTIGIAEAKIIAIYAVGAAERYVDGCGDRTHIVSLANDGSIQGVTWDETEPVQQALELFDSGVRMLLFSLLTDTDRDFDGIRDVFKHKMGDARVALGLDDKANRAMRAMRSSQAQSTPDQPIQPPSQE